MIDKANMDKMLTTLRQRLGILNADHAVYVLYKCLHTNAESHIKGVSGEIYGAFDLKKYFDVKKVNDNDREKRYDFEVQRRVEDG